MEGSGNAGKTILSDSLAFDRYFRSFRSEACEGGGGGGGSPAGGGAAPEPLLLSSLEL